MDERYLTLLAEEAAEVIHAVMKIQRFGPDHFYRKEGCLNKDYLALEVGGLIEIIERLKLSVTTIKAGREDKVFRLKSYGPEVRDDYSISSELNKSALKKDLNRADEWR